MLFDLLVSRALRVFLLRSIGEVQSHISMERCLQTEMILTKLNLLSCLFSSLNKTLEFSQQDESIFCLFNRYSRTTSTALATNAHDKTRKKLNMPNTLLPLASDVSLPNPEEPYPPTPLDHQIGQNFSRLVALMRRLLGPNGCPWDREQSFATLRRYVLEEACEVIDAIDRNDFQHLQEELGDLLLQIVFQSELARCEHLFGPDDVIEAIVSKLIRRHPHVFGHRQVQGADEVLQNWEQIKAQEKSRTQGVLDGIPRALPALVRAQRVGEKAQRVGFDWADISGSRAKVTEELQELDEAILSNNYEAITEELGDVLFALVNLARHVETSDRGGIDAEAALRKTIDKFTARFAIVEARVHNELGGFASKPSLEVLDAMWQEAKRFEKIE